MKRAILRVSPEFLLALCKPTPEPRWHRVLDFAIPEDATLVDFQCVSDDAIELLIESSSFGDLPDRQGRFDGVRYPVLERPIFALVRQGGAS